MEAKSEIKQLRTKLEKAQQRVADLELALVENRKSNPTRHAPQDQESQPEQPRPETPRIRPIYYRKNWAVNYRERERVLRELKDILSDHPDARISLVGHADDSRFGQTNQDVSANRAVFLARYLMIHGISQKSFRSYKGVGNSRPPAIGPNRRVDILISE